MKKIKKLLIALLVAVILAVAFAVPVLADSPDEPGGFGEVMSGPMQGETGVSTNIHAAMDEEGGKPLGAQVKTFLEQEFGIPPAHTP